VARIELAPEIAEDFERILEHLATHEVSDAPRRLEEILAALDILGQNPVDRPAGTP